MSDANQALAPPHADPATRIITFYSFKGGTGRTMALANVAWILASQGHTVLTIDWDLEAPGLHRYFAPFLPDPTLAESAGLIDFLYRYIVAAGKPHPDGTRSDVDWYKSFASVDNFVEPLQWEFPNHGRIDLLGAGQQVPAYAGRVTRFKWHEFYERFGGGAFLEEAVRQMREVLKYDYVLIDSRTGVSDTSGICTVHLPDSLAVFYTLNDQSIEGASSAAAGAIKRRREIDGDERFRVYPMATRIELAESEKLRARRARAAQQFAPIVDWLRDSRARDEYFGRMEVLYIPFYAYEESLATIWDEPGRQNSVLAAMELLTAQLTDGRVTGLASMGASKREEAQRRYPQPVDAQAQAKSHDKRWDAFISAAASERSQARKLHAALTSYFEVFLDEVSVKPGERIEQAVGQASGNARFWLALIGAAPDKRQAHELREALARNRRVLPVYLGEQAKERATAELPELTSVQGVVVDEKGDDWSPLVKALIEETTTSGSYPGTMAGTRLPSSGMPPTSAEPPVPATAAGSKGSLFKKLAFMTVVVIAVIFAGSRFKLNLDSAEREVQAERLAASSQQVRDRDPTLSLLLATEAVHRASTDTTMTALRGALQASRELRVLPKLDNPSAVAFSPNGQHLLVLYRAGRIALIDDLFAPRSAVSNTSSPAWAGGDYTDGSIDKVDNVTDARWNLGLSRQVSATIATASGSIFSWRADARASLAELATLSFDGAQDARLSPDSGSVLTVSTAAADSKAVDARRRCTLWRVGKDYQAHALSEDCELPANPWAMSGERVAVVSRGKLQVWGVDGRLFREFEVSGINDLAWDPDGQRLAIAGNSRIDIASLDKQFLSGGGPGAALAERMVIASPAVIVRFSADGELLAFVDAEGALLEIWRQGGAPAARRKSLVRAALQAPQVPESRRYHSIRDVGPVSDIRFSPDSNRLAVAGTDGAIHIHTMIGKAQPILLRGHHTAVNTLAWNTDGATLASGGADGTVRVWDVSGSGPDVGIDQAGLLELARQRRSRPLSQDERREYLNETQPQAQVQNR